MADIDPANLGPEEPAADPTGIADSSDAFNTAFDMLRTGAAGRTFGVAGRGALFFGNRIRPTPGFYRLQQPINATNIAADWSFDFSGSSLLFDHTGTPGPGIDLLGSRFYKVIGGYAVGMPNVDLTPRCHTGFQFGRYNSSSAAPKMVQSLQVYGYFERAAVGAYACEIVPWIACNFRNNWRGGAAHAMIHTGIFKDHLPVSPFVTVSHGEGAGFNENAFYNCTFQRLHMIPNPSPGQPLDLPVGDRPENSHALYTGGLGRHTWISSFAFNNGNGAVVTLNDQSWGCYWDIHLEPGGGPMPFGYEFRPGTNPARGITDIQYPSFRFREHAMQSRLGFFAAREMDRVRLADVTVEISSMSSAITDIPRLSWEPEKFEGYMGRLAFPVDQQGGGTTPMRGINWNVFTGDLLVEDLRKYQKQELPRRGMFRAYDTKGAGVLYNPVFDWTGPRPAGGLYV